MIYFVECFAKVLKILKSVHYFVYKRSADNLSTKIFYIN